VAEDSHDPIARHLVADATGGRPRPARPLASRHRLLSSRRPETTASSRSVARRACAARQRALGVGRAGMADPAFLRGLTRVRRWGNATAAAPEEEVGVEQKKIAWDLHTFITLMVGCVCRARAQHARFARKNIL